MRPVSTFFDIQLSNSRDDLILETDGQDESAHL